MDRVEIENKVKEVLAEKLNIPLEQIKLSSSLREDLGMDSFASVEVVFEIEDKFNIEVPDQEVANIKTVTDIINYIGSRFNKNE
jgi:acyl carrier protein